MNKHIIKPSSFLSEVISEGQTFADPLQNNERSKSRCHENRLNYSENSQNSSKIEEKES